MTTVSQGTRSGLGALRPGQLAVLVMTLVVIVTNVLANALPIAGRTTGDISDGFTASVVTPSGYVFAIWGLIYLGLFAYAVWQVLPAQADNPRVQMVAWPVTVGHVANTLWIVAWHYLAFGASLLLMLVLLASLIVTYLRLRSAPGGAGRGRSEPGATERLLARGTFSVYLGWITVATVANVTIWLLSIGWDGGFLPAAVWGAITLVVATLLGVRMLLRYRDAAYAAVLVWAFVGIVVNQFATPLVAATAIVGVLALLYVAAVTFGRRGYTAST